MSVRSILFLVFGVLIAALGAQAVVALLKGREMAEQREAEDRRFASYLLADELRQSSDELTRFARTYAVTGDERFKTYFQQVLLVRDGKLPRPPGYEGIYWDLVAATDQPLPATGRKAALLDLMREQGFTAAELAKLEEAKQRSDALVGLENRAMDAMQGRLPSEDGGTRPGAPDPALARALLHGPEYHQAKAAIMEPIQDFFRMVDARTAADVAVHRQRSDRLSGVSIGVALGAGVLAVLALVALTRRMLRPVVAVGDRLQAMALGLSGASNEQQVGASEQSAAVEETRQTFEGLLQGTRRLARVGADVLANAEQAQGNAQTIAARIRDLSASTDAIAEILRLVKDIANKSEVLALNAALEGTKAGEAGRGFSLVATQMQRLAEKVMDAARRMDALTGEIRAAGQNAVLAAEEAETVAGHTTEAAREIAEAVALQQSGAQQVSVAMNEISQVAERSVDAARQMVSAAGDLDALAGQLQRALHGRPGGPAGS